MNAPIWDTVPTWVPRGANPLAYAPNRVYAQGHKSGPRRRLSANRGPDQKEIPLLMANTNPTAHRAGVIRKGDR